MYLKKPNDDPARLLDALRRLVQVLRAASHSAETALTISGAQLFVLQLVAEHEGLSLSQLAARTLTDQSSVSAVASRLAARKLVRRARADDDARRWSIALTPAGRALLRRAPPMPQAKMLAAMTALTPRELRTARRVLETLVRAAGAERARPGMFFEPPPRQVKS